MKKYGFVMLLVIFCRSAFAGCDFANITSYNFTPVNIQPISLTNNTNEPQLVASYSTNGSPALMTRYNEDYQSDMNVWTTSSIKPLTTKTSTGAVLFPINLDGSGSATASGYAFAFKISSGSRSAYITDISNMSQPLFTNLEKSECDNKKWDITLELWHVNSYLRDEKKYSAITPLSDVYFRLQFTGDYDNSDAFISLSSFSIPVTPVTCNLSVNSPVIDFGELSFNNVNAWPAQTVTLTSNNCSQVGLAEMHILANGNPVENFALLNKLTGDDAADGISLKFFRLANPTDSDAPIPIETDDSPDYTNISNCDDTTFGSDGFISSCTHTIFAVMKKGGYYSTQKNGKFEASATFSVTYY